jgi:hypothetical protein
MNRLTRHEQMVLCAIFSLLLVGLAVKSYRASHPGRLAVEPVAPAGSTNLAAGRM